MPDPAERRESHEVPAEIASLAAEADGVAAATGNPVAAEVADTIAAAEHHPPRRLVLRIAIALVFVAALVVAGWRSGLYRELYRLRQAPPQLVALMAALWLASRYPAADGMPVGLRALRH